MGQFVKQWLARLLRRSRRPVVAVFLSGDAGRSRRMALRMRELVPDYPHVVISPAPLDRDAFAYAEEVIEVPAGLAAAWREARRRLRGRWIALAPFVWKPAGRLRWLPWLLAPHKLLAFNADLERHHLRPSCPLASWRFLRGEAVGDIFRPTLLGWLFRRPPEPEVQVFAGRAASPERRRVAVVTPYLPFPLSHGGALRIYNLLRCAAPHTDVYLFAFAERDSARGVAPLLDFCARVTLVSTPRWEPPSLRPPGVAQFHSRAMEEALARTVARERIPLVQVEYTQLAHLAAPRGVSTLLVEHDVTFDLHRQIRLRARGPARLAAYFAEIRWRRFELGQARRYHRVIAMSEDDRDRLAQAGVPAGRLAVVPNGVDLGRFRPSPPPSEPHLLFVGSFRHFPNVLGYRFLLDRVWPKVRPACPELRLTVVAGGDHRYYWRRHTGAGLPDPPPQVEVLDFVEDVRPLYERASIVVVPLEVSAGTNLKVLEALAMERPVVSTAVGVAGLGLTSGEHVRIADRADSFAADILYLLWNPEARREIAAAGRAFVEERYGWDRLAQRLAAVWDELADQRTAT
jgi:glycosyltransferase involved in cell wall biosynthesis